MNQAVRAIHVDDLERFLPSGVWPLSDPGMWVALAVESGSVDCTLHVRLARVPNFTDRIVPRQPPARLENVEQR